VVLVAGKAALSPAGQEVFSKIFDLGIEEKSKNFFLGRGCKPQFPVQRLRGQSRALS
jgi:hypothetical protein